MPLSLIGKAEKETSLSVIRKSHRFSFLMFSPVCHLPLPKVSLSEGCSPYLPLARVTRKKRKKKLNIDFSNSDDCTTWEEA